jgi:hypothetical protein
MMANQTEDMYSSQDFCNQIRIDSSILGWIRNFCQFVRDFAKILYREMHIHLTVRFSLVCLIKTFNVYYAGKKISRNFAEISYPPYTLLFFYKKKKWLFCSTDKRVSLAEINKKAKN